MAELLDTQLFAAYLMNEVVLFQENQNGTLCYGSCMLIFVFVCRFPHGFPTKTLAVLKQHVLKGEPIQDMMPASTEHSLKIVCVC
jgi:hypothetical protein